jgi:hypothetical protein
MPVVKLSASNVISQFLFYLAMTLFTWSGEAAGEAAGVFSLVLGVLDQM